LKASGNLLVGLSGGLGSTVLLDLVNQSYFSTQEPPDHTGKPRGGKDHPRNSSVWQQATVCYVETCSAFPGVRLFSGLSSDDPNFVRQMRDRTDEIRAVVQSYHKFNFTALRVEDAFSDDWWEKIGGQLPQKDLGVNITNEGR
jgi:cytoplasmic tRNA 2-thiolation protein 2